MFVATLEPRVMGSAPMGQNGEPHSTVIDVSPALAAMWLAQVHPDQRRLRSGWVDTLATDMVAGRWKLTHQGIAFDTHGRLLDGQHRLQAVVASDVTVRMKVDFGIDPSAYEVTDAGRPRSIVDRISDDWIRQKEVALARRMMAGLLPQLLPTPSDQEIRAFIYRHEDAIRFSRSLFGTNKRGLSQAAVQAVVARAWYTAPQSDLVSFAGRVYDGAVSDPALSSVIRLRDFLLSAHTGGGARAGVEAYARTSRALRAYIDRQPIAKLYAASEELFPIPA